MQVQRPVTKFLRSVFFFLLSFQTELSVTHDSDILHVAELILDTVIILGVEDSPVSVNNTGTGEECGFTYNATNRVLEILALNHSMADELTLSFVYQE